jgi:hypothetical protein
MQVTAADRQHLGAPAQVAGSAAAMILWLPHL